MLKKIIAGNGQGVDRAAVELANKAGIAFESRSHQCVRTAKALKGKKRETVSCKGRAGRLLDADGTLLFSNGVGSSVIADTTSTLNKVDFPMLHIDLNRLDVFQASVKIVNWIKNNDILTLNVVGSEADSGAEFYRQTLDVLEIVLYLMVHDISVPAHLSFVDYKNRLKPDNLPATVDEVADLILSDFSLKERVNLGKMQYKQLKRFFRSTEDYINSEFRIWTGNQALLESCRKHAGVKSLRMHQPARIIIEAMWRKVRDTHRIRKIK